MGKAWIAHVKATHKKLGGSYKDAMKAAAKTWKSKKKEGGSMTRVAKATQKKKLGGRIKAKIKVSEL